MAVVPESLVLSWGGEGMAQLERQESSAETTHIVAHQEAESLDQTRPTFTSCAPLDTSSQKTVFKACACGSHAQFKP